VAEGIVSFAGEASSVANEHPSARTSATLIASLNLVLGAAMARSLFLLLLVLQARFPCLLFLQQSHYDTTLFGIDLRRQELSKQCNVLLSDPRLHFESPEHQGSIDPCALCWRMSNMFKLDHQTVLPCPL
jgi:hypothetical protein